MIYYISTPINYRLLDLLSFLIFPDSSMAFWESSKVVAFFGIPGSSLYFMNHDSPQRRAEDVPATWSIGPLHSGPTDGPEQGSTTDEITSEIMVP